ncbi:hypothetical protein BDP55DRAFT_637794 [Colletotrichum godetiae]|uniref:Uncharacterized protein n=1 Tax=Colletotrichum godetiae TaxID=1209918 RepID=A0AAJ0A8E6_9PEZI|nr:uncharacterized protein BDP55DRAFT_637794 [Colletotrichum godetiae]KAK1658434.1 hypothetical protein BDP55DRAFT_637794 [Colletotrichum godetiae]
MSSPVSPMSVSERGVWDSMLEMITDNSRADIQWLIGRDEQDLQWVGDLKASMSQASLPTASPLWLQIRTTRELRAWEAIRKSCIILVDCDMHSKWWWDCFHASELSAWCRELANELRSQFHDQKAVGSLAFFMGGTARKEGEKSGIVALIMMTSLIYQIIDIYARKFCPDEAGQVLAFESAKRDDIGYLCNFFGLLVHKVTLELELTCFIDFVGPYDTENGMDTVMDSLITLVEDQAKNPIHKAFKLVFTGPGPRGGPRLRIHDLLSKKRHIAASYYFRVQADKERGFEMGS